jgi:hypothetical protein
MGLHPVLLLIAVVYFIPTVVALARHRPNTISIFFLNLSVGWSIVGWIIALFWAIADAERTGDAPPRIVMRDDPISTLEKLARLRDKGILTEEEFSQQKAKILG